MTVRGLDYFFNCRKEKWEKENDLINYVLFSNYSALQNGYFGTCKIGCFFPLSFFVKFFRDIQTYDIND